MKRLVWSYSLHASYSTGGRGRVVSWSATKLNTKTQLPQGIYRYRKDFTAIRGTYN